MSHALPSPQRVANAERQALRRERKARAKQRHTLCLLQTLLKQSQAVRQRQARIKDCPELWALTRIARDSVHRRVVFAGVEFSVRRGAVFSAIHIAHGEHLVSIPGAIFDL